MLVQPGTLPLSAQGQLNTGHHALVLEVQWWCEWLLAEGAPLLLGMIRNLAVLGIG